MKHTVVNDLNHFSYHDAEIQEMKWHDNNLVFVVSEINATTTNAQNSHCKDMCIDNANILFENAHIESIVFNAYKTYDSNKNLVKSVEAETATEEEYADILRESLNDYCYILSMSNYKKSTDDRYTICFIIDGGAGSYDLTISFVRSTISWKDFLGEAWYEHLKWKKQEG